MPKAVCFDAYGTLLTVTDPARRLAERLTRALGSPVSLEAAAAAFRAEVALYRVISIEGRDEPARMDVVRRCAGALGAELARWIDHGLAVEQLAVILLDSLSFELQPGAEDCLRTLAEHGVRLAVVSNWDCSLRRVLGALGVADYFTAIVASAEVGCEKPDPGIWRPALAALGLPPSDVWHVGDEPEADVAGALAARLRPVLLGDAALTGAAEAPRIGSLAELAPLLFSAES